MCSVKKVFLWISQNSQENTCAAVSFLIKLQRPATLIKKKLWYRCFPVNFVKFLRTSFCIEHLCWLILDNSYWKLNNSTHYSHLLQHLVNAISQSAFTCSKLTIETLGQGVKYWTYCTPCPSVSIVNFEHVIAIWVFSFCNEPSD